MTIEEVRKRREQPLDTPSNLGSNGTKDVAAAFTALLADVFALYVKTKNSHWHISGPHCRDYHLLLDEQAAQILSMADDIAERARKIGGTTIRLIGHIARLKHIPDADFGPLTTCWPSSRRTTWRSRSALGRPTMFAMSTATWPQPA